MANWKKVIIIALDVVIGAYLVLAITAFNKPGATSAVCNEVRINVEASDPAGFLSEDDVRTLLVNNRILPIGQPMDDISVRQIEEKLQANALIEEVHCYKTQAGNVCINVKQLVPMVRVMAQNGDNYFVDNHGNTMHPGNYTCDAIVATGAVTRSYASRKLAPLVRSILSDSFWKKQVVQLNVLADGSVELVPRVGDHIVYLGQPTGVERKLDRVRKFYRYGLSQAGWNKYGRISVEFDNQIICKRR